MRFICQFLFLAVFCLGFDRVEAQEWAQLQHDPAHTGRTGATIVPSRLSLAWSVSGYYKPRIVGQSVFAVAYVDNGNSTSVNSFSLETGKLNWSYSITGLYFGTATPSGESLPSWVTISTSAILP